MLAASSRGSGSSTPGIGRRAGPGSSVVVARAFGGSDVGAAAGGGSEVEGGGGSGGSMAFAISDANKADFAQVLFIAHR